MIEWNDDNDDDDDDYFLFFFGGGADSKIEGGFLFSCWAVNWVNI